MLIRDAQPLRAPRHRATTLARSASRRTTRRCVRFLGVPILLRGVAYGNLYLTEKAGGGDFTQDDEELSAAARRPGGGRDRERPPLRVLDALAAPARVAERDRRTRSPSELELAPLLELVARRLRELVDARRRDDRAARPGGDAARRGGRRRGRRRARRDAPRARRVEVGTGPRAPAAASASTPFSTTPRSTRRRRPAHRGPGRALRPADRPGPGDRRRRRARQGSAPDPRFSDDDLRLAEMLRGAGRDRRRPLEAGERVTRSAGSSRRRSSSARGSRASSTTRPGRRSPRCCSA